MHIESIWRNKKQIRKSELSAQQNQLKILEKDIADVKLKIEGLQNTCDLLDAEFDSSVFQAEEEPENSIAIISKSTALKRKSNEKKQDIKKVEETLKIIDAKRKCVKNWLFCHMLYTIFL